MFFVYGLDNVSVTKNFERKIEMDMNIYREIYFFDTVLKDEHNQKDYEVCIADDDIFFIYVQDYLERSIGESLTYIPIDVLTIHADEQEVFECEELTFILNLNVRNQENCIEEYLVEINNIRIVGVEKANKKFDCDGYCSVKNCAIEFQTNPIIWIKRK